MANKRCKQFNKAALVMLVVATLLIVNVCSAAAEKSAADIVDENQLSLVRLYVEITADVKYPDPLFDQYTLTYYPSTVIRRSQITATAHCTGFVITPDGYLATANHCVFFTNEDLDGILMNEVLNQVYQAIQNEVNTYDTSSLPEGTMDAVEYLTNQLFNYLYQYVTFENIDVKWYVSPSKEAVGKGGYELVNTRQPAIATFGGGLPAPGQVVAPEDIAFLKINQKNLKPVAVGDANKLRTGETLYALGYPWVVSPDMAGTPKDELTPTLTGGLVSAKKQNEYGIDLIQLDAQLAGGNSGGPVFNGNGEVVGVVSFGFGENVNYNFAVSSNVLTDFMERNNMPINTGQKEVEKPVTGQPTTIGTGQPIVQQQTPTGGTDMTLLMVIAIIVVAVVLVIVVVMMKGKGVKIGAASKPATETKTSGGTPAHNFCPVCRAKVKQSDKYCENCGSAL